MTTTGMQHGTETVVEWLRDVSRTLPARYYMTRDDITALVDDEAVTLATLRDFSERLVFRLSAQLELGGDSLEPVTALALRQAHLSATLALRACDYAVVVNDPPGLDTLDALDLGYLISVCELPRSYHVWGERAAAAQDRAIDVIEALIPGGYDKRWTVEEYGQAARHTFKYNGFSYQDVMGA